MRIITDIYQEYNIMPQLQLHQLRVAAVAKQICDSLEIEIDEHSIIIACLLHDMANIVKFKLDHFPEFLKPQGLEYWQHIQNKYIEKYGKDDHEATRTLVHSMSLPIKVLELLDKCLDHTVKENINSFGLPACICKYADTRLTPHGVMPLRERLEEWQQRDPRITLEHMESTYNTFKLVEDGIFSHSNIKPEDINDESISPVVEILKNFKL